MPNNIVIEYELDDFFTQFSLGVEAVILEVGPVLDLPLHVVPTLNPVGDPPILVPLVVQHHRQQHTAPEALTKDSPLEDIVQVQQQGVEREHVQDEEVVQHLQLQLLQKQTLIPLLLTAVSTDAESGHLPLQPHHNVDEAL